MKVLTANRLTDGEAVWFSPARHWAETIGEADVAEDKVREAELEAAPLRQDAAGEGAGRDRLDQSGRPAQSAAGARRRGGAGEGDDDRRRRRQ